MLEACDIRREPKTRNIRLTKKILRAKCPQKTITSVQNNFNELIHLLCTPYIKFHEAETKITTSFLILKFV